MSLRSDHTMTPILPHHLYIRFDWYRWKIQMFFRMWVKLKIEVSDGRPMWGGVGGTAPSPSRLCHCKAVIG